MNKTQVRKVWYKKSSNQKMVTIEKDSDIQPGDYVSITKLEDQDGKTKEEY